MPRRRAGRHSAFVERFNDAMTGVIEQQRFDTIGEAEMWLALRLRVHQSTVHRWVQGSYAPRLDQVEQIARALNVSQGWLLGEDPPSTADQLEAELRRIRQREKKLRPVSDAD